MAFTFSGLGAALRARWRLLALVAAGGGIAVLAAWMLLFREGPAIPQTPWIIKRSIYSFLKKHSGQVDFTAPYDLNLASKVERMRADLAALRARGQAAQTNAVETRQQARDLAKTVQTLAAQEQSLRSGLPSASNELAALRRRLAQKTTDCALAQSNVLRAQTNSAAASREKTLAALGAALAAQQTTLAALQSNVTAAESALETRRAEWAARQQELAARKAEADAQQKTVADLQTEGTARQKEAAELQRTLAAKEQELASQSRLFAADVRRRVADAISYETIYRVIGQELWVADRLLDSSEPAKQQAALNLAAEASQIAMTDAQSGWLAGRICEAYIWPNLDRADAPGQPRANADRLLQHCGMIFQRGEEYPMVIRNFELALDVVTNEVRADALRYYLGLTLEQTSNYTDALKWYREISTTNFLAQAAARIPATEARVRAAAPKKTGP